MHTYPSDVEDDECSFVCPYPMLDVCSPCHPLTEPVTDGNS